AALEAALEATGMLDAWITPGDHEITVGDSDGYLVPGAPVPGTSLADVLVSEEKTPVPAARVGAVLASIALDGELFSSAAVIGADGRYSHGITAGAHHKNHAEYIGATARARRRAARIAEREARIAELEDLLADLDRTAAGLADTLAALAQARAALPRTAAARGRLERATEEERACAETELAARRRHTEEAAKLAALQGAVGKDAREVMTQIEATERAMSAAQSAGHSARNAEVEAIKAASAAAERVSGGRRALDVAIQEERATARGLAPFASRELLDVLKCPPGLAWPAQAADWTGDDLPQPVIDVHEAILE